MYLFCTRSSCTLCRALLYFSSFMGVYILLYLFNGLKRLGFDL